MSRPPRPEGSDIEYSGFPTPEFAEARSLSATASLAKFLGVDEARALDLLAHPAEYAAELRSRSRLTVREAMRQLERRYLPPG
jgi:hypothetical protein